MKAISKNNYKVGIKVVAVALVFSLAMWASYVHGEQVGGALESGSTSYVKSLYTALQTSGYGSDTASPDWGTYWNRLETSAQWVPSGTATVTDVFSGKTFYGSSSSRTQQTGVAPGSPGNCPTQAYDDYHGAPVTQTTNCTNALTWTVITGTEKQDPRSGLIWSNLIINSAGTATFSPTTGWALFSWDASGAANIAVGNKTAITLCSAMGNGWRLPNQKEFMQAYIDGANFNLVQPAGNGYYLWSATNSGSGGYPWFVDLSSGTTNNTSQSSTKAVRCVR